MDYTFSKTQFWEKLFYDAHTKSAETKDAGGDQDFMGSNDEDGDPESDEIEGQEFKYFDAPPTWVSPLALHRTKYTLRYPPSGKRSIQYYCSKADFFAKRKNSQSMVMRISTYLDKACTILKEVHEWYDNRQDKMYKRARYFLGNRRFVEFYHPGSFGEVKKWTEYPGKSIEVDFYVNGRLDRLARREEIIGKSVVEYFHDRTDFLVYRSVDLCPASPNANGTRQFVLPGGSLSSELHITKMVQEFDRDPADTNGSSIAKRVFNVREGKGVFYHHFGKGQITGKVKTYFHTKGPTVPTISEQALAQEVGVDDDPDALLEASALERECYTSVKASFQQSDKVTDFRKDVERELEIPIEQTVFEIALENVDRGMSFQGSNMDKFTSQESKGSDYLTPFLRNVRDPTSLTREEALEVRQTCLDALKARLVERANIIQTRLHDENAKLGKKQEQFQRSQREGDLSTEEYEKYCTEAMFRIQILEQRLASHEEAALRKFADLDIKLSSDPRLKVLRN